MLLAFIAMTYANRLPYIHSIRLYIISEFEWLYHCDPHT